MSRARPVLSKKCRRCQVAAKIGGCLFGCNQKEKLTRQLKLLMAEAESHTDPLLELLRQCPEAFNVGAAVERMVELRQRNSDNRVRPPNGVVMIPFA